MVLEKLAVAKSFFCTWRYGGFAAMKNGYLMSALLKLLRREPPDKAAAADEKNFHRALILCLDCENTLVMTLRGCEQIR